MGHINNIEEIVFDLNEKIDNYSAGLYNVKDGIEVMSHFTYETAGYYSCIKFGDEVLWNSEDEPREFIEDKNEYEDLAIFVKKQFNKYINTLNSFRFYDVEGNIKKNILKDAYKLMDFIDENLTEDNANKIYNKILKTINKIIE